MKRHRVCVVGAGWSGLAAAVHAVQAGHRVTVLEASRSLGGRARTLPASAYGLLPDGTPAGGMTGREAGHRYERMVVPELLKRGCYPVFAARKVANFLSAGAGTDFFEEVAIVRYRSRRDLLAMAASRAFLAGVPHKWASLEKTVAVPSRLLLLADPRTLVPLILLAAWAVILAVLPT